ncbi:hypothetical protein ABQJ54_09440 [Rhodanobacter sp. Si-c]|uniref:Transmembrane protein n=1 Tax=Rhodanobacter lycopersici TaxID=3162487 RepID=A0ABV3QDU8_9GAMM
MSSRRMWLERAGDAAHWMAVRRPVQADAWVVAEAGQGASGTARTLPWYFAVLLASSALLTCVTPPVWRVLGMDELQHCIGLAALVVAAGIWLGFGICWMLQHAGISLPAPVLGFWGMPLLYVFARRWAGRRYA